VDGLRRVSGETARPKLIAWLGSNVGNFDRAAAGHFLGRIREALGERDRLLLGVDLRKDGAVLEAAYDDAAGVTARFNLNLLERINRDLDGDFDVRAFAHRATYLADEGRVVLELVSRRDQRVRIGALDLVVDLAAGEAIHTEDSYKYSFDEVAALAAAADLEIERRRARLLQPPPAAPVAARDGTCPQRQRPETVAGSGPPWEGDFFVYKGCGDRDGEVSGNRKKIFAPRG
jgi:uncharacterized SAM-dependent methyltransferase